MLLSFADVTGAPLKFSFHFFYFSKAVIFFCFNYSFLKMGPSGNYTWFDVFCFNYIWRLIELVDL